MKLVDPPDEEENQENGDSNNLFSQDTDLRRSFTVRAQDEGSADLLSIDRQDLFRMRIEFRENFAQFLKSGIALLEKVITMKIYAMDSCDKQFLIWANAKSIGVPEYAVKPLTNREMLTMSHSEVVSFTEKSKSHGIVKMSTRTRISTLMHQE